MNTLPHNGAIITFERPEITRAELGLLDELVEAATDKLRNFPTYPGAYFETQMCMLVNKWTVRISYPGQLVEKAFDSEADLLAYIDRLDSNSVTDAHPIATVIDPGGQESSISLVEVAVPSRS
ncbi:MAG: hypothetical protein ACJ74Y_15700 [Bryobacteraceae bacterium]